MKFLSIFIQSGILLIIFYRLLRFLNLLSLRVSADSITRLEHFN